VKNEVVIAIFIGCILGLVIAFGIRNANQALKTAQITPAPESNQIQNSDTASDQVTPIPLNKSLLTISSPENNSLVSSEKIEIAGKTEPGMTILFVYEDNENLISSDSQGDFKQEITLVGGQNQINISVFDNNGNETTKTLNLVYSTAEI